MSFFGTPQTSHIYLIKIYWVYKKRVLLIQGFLVVVLKSLLQAAYGGHNNNLVNYIVISVSHRTMHMTRLSW